MVQKYTINQIESSVKIGALIGMAISAIITAMIAQLAQIGTISFELFLALAYIFVFFFVLQVMYYVKFIIEKLLFLKEQQIFANIQNQTADKEMKKLGLKRDILTLELQLAEQGVSTTAVA